MTLSTPPLAEVAAELTPAWFTTALRSSGVIGADTEVVSADAAPLGTGQMCDSLRVALTLSNGALSTGPSGDGPLGDLLPVIVKLPSSDPGSRAAGVNLRAYEKEVRFYEDLAAGLPVPTPARLYSALVAGTASFVLVLEDLSPARVGDQLAGCSPAEADAAVQALVGLHAPRWGHATLSELEWLHGNLDVSRMFMSMLVPGSWAGFLDRFGERIPDHLRRVGDALIGGLDAYLAPTGRPLTITHGDYRLDNLLFDADGQVKAVLDWQTCAVGPALSDVAYFLGAGLLAEDRRHHEEEIVRRYHHSLTAAGVADYSWDDCWTDHRRGSFSGLVMAMVASGLVERTDRGDEMFLAMASRHAQHAIDIDALDLL